MFFENLFRIFTSDSIDSGVSQSCVSAGGKKEMPHPNNNPNCDDPYTRYAGDIYALVNEFGVLEKNKCITITLQKMLQIAPRHRRRIESYQGLISFLRDEIGVTLKIVSNKTKE